MPGSDFRTITDPDEGMHMLGSKCAFSHCSSVDDASAILMMTCIPQKKLFKEDKLDCSSTESTSQSAMTIGKISAR